MVACLQVLTLFIAAMYEEGHASADLRLTGLGFLGQLPLPSLRETYPVCLLWLPGPRTSLDARRRRKSIAKQIPSFLYLSI